MRECPVRFLTVETRMVLSLFQSCYEPMAVGFGGVVWQRRAWPETGDLAAQDPWLLSALEFVRSIKNSLLHERVSQGENEA